MKDEETSKLLYLQLKQELLPYINIMTKAAETIMVKDISKYPILVVHQQEVELGVPVLNKNEEKIKWSIHASTLEEFAMKQVIAADKIEDFQGVYKNPDQFLCLFVISELGVNFIFIPRMDHPN